MCNCICNNRENGNAEREEREKDYTAFLKEKNQKELIKSWRKDLSETGEARRRYMTLKQRERKGALLVASLLGLSGWYSTMQVSWIAQ